jgi:preprotein translocase subunit SecG
MGILEIFFLILIILAAIVLVLFVMIQDETGEGMGGIFGGGSTTPFGSRAGNVLTRLTAIIAVVFFVSTITYAFLKRTPKDSSDVLNKAKEKKYEQSTAGAWFFDLPQAQTGTPVSEGSGNLILEGSNGSSVKTGTTTTTATTTTKTTDTKDTKQPKPAGNK